MDNDRIRVRTNIPGLENKVRTNIAGPSDAIYWYIRFNIPLDESTVNGKTMNVTDTEGYIMRTDISFNRKTNMIAVSPLDTYEENRFYLLNISKKVCSASGKKLRSAIHIMFKLYGGKVGDYRTLKQEEVIPKPKPRPTDYDDRQVNRQPTYLERRYEDGPPKMVLAPVGFSVNLIVGVLGLGVVIAGLATGNLILALLGALVCIAGTTHILVQLRNPKIRSKLLYNKGVQLLHGQRYQEAEQAFQRALSANPNNKKAENGMQEAAAMYR